jgi:hypothetical protein
MPAESKLARVHQAGSVRAAALDLAQMVNAHHQFDDFLSRPRCPPSLARDLAAMHSANCPIPTQKFAQSQFNNQDWLMKSSLIRVGPRHVDDF